MAHMAHIFETDTLPRRTLTCIPPHHHDAVFAPRDDILVPPDPPMARNPPPPTWNGMPVPPGVTMPPRGLPRASLVIDAAMRNRGPPVIPLPALTHPAAWGTAYACNAPGPAAGGVEATHPASWRSAVEMRQRAALSGAELNNLYMEEGRQALRQLMAVSGRPPPPQFPSFSAPHSVGAAFAQRATSLAGAREHPGYLRRGARTRAAAGQGSDKTHPASWRPMTARTLCSNQVDANAMAADRTHPAAWVLPVAKKTETRPTPETRPTLETRPTPETRPTLETGPTPETQPTPEKDTVAATTYQGTWPSDKVEAELAPSVKKRGLPLPIAAPTLQRPSLRRRLIWVEVLLALVVAAMFIFGMPAGSWSARTALAPVLPPSVIDVPPIPPKRISECRDLLPIPAGTYTGRLQRLAAALGDKSRHVGVHDTPVWISEPGPSVEYFIGAFGTGVWSPSERPFLVAVAGTAEDVQVVLLTPAFEASRARLIPIPDEVAKVATWLTWAESESPYTVLLHHLGHGRGVVLDGAVRTFIADGLRARGASVDRDAARASAVTSLRERKDEREIGLMRCANEFTLHAIRRTRAQMSLGIKESETRAILYSEMKALGLSDYGALVLFGENAALPHGRGTDRVLGETDLVLIDAGGRWGGYVADITRTFALPASRISDAHIEVWEIVRAAQRAPANLLSLVDVRDRVLMSWLDDRARETVKKGMAAWGVPPAKGAGPDYTVFTHRLGHGIGLEGHESPYAVQGPLGERELRTGNAFTFEPGVYIPADATVGDDNVRGLGVRLEDVVVVRERQDGRWMVEWLTGPVQKWGEV